MELLRHGADEDWLKDLIAVSKAEALQKYRETYTYSRQRLARTDRRELARQLLSQQEQAMGASREEQTKRQGAGESDCKAISSPRASGLRASRSSSTVPTGAALIYTGPHSESDCKNETLVPFHVTALPLRPAPKRTEKRVTTSVRERSLRSLGKTDKTEEASESCPRLSTGKEQQSTNLLRVPGILDTRARGRQLLRRRRMQYCMSPREIPHYVSRESCSPTDSSPRRHSPSGDPGVRLEEADGPLENKALRTSEIPLRNPLQIQISCHVTLVKDEPSPERRTAESKTGINSSTCEADLRRSPISGHMALRLPQTAKPQCDSGRGHAILDVY